MLRRDSQHLLGQRHDFTPLALFGGLVQSNQQIGKNLPMVIEIVGEAIQCRRAIQQAAANAFHRVAGGSQFAAVGQFTRLQPIADRFFQHLKFRRACSAFAQMGDYFVGSPHVAGLQQRANLGESQANQRAAERINPLLRCLQLFGLQQIAPGALDIFALEAAFAALHISANELRH